MRYSVGIPGSIDLSLKEHLLRQDSQEDLCYALWYPSKGANRFSALVYEPILPVDGERMVHGNASTTGDYLDRAIELARKRKAGIAFLHSHPLGIGWQGTSHDDETTERRQAPSVYGATSLPLLGMTLAGDGAWSARFWIRSAQRVYDQEWCENVRTIGNRGLGVTFNNVLIPPPEFREELKRTISAWGERSQQKLARLRIGIVGVGSVGSIVAETLARMGVQHIRLIDFDRVERHNLDRLLHATSNDARQHRLKVNIVGEALSRHATAAKLVIDKLPLAITEESGLREALDCDILFSCVDRPWARHVLNYIAYAYLIPVIDGGILIRMRGGQLRSASWRSHAVYPGRRCLQCIGQYDPDLVNVERRGDLDDPTYIENLPADHSLRRNENVFPFSAHLASSLVVHALHVALQPVGIVDIGEQIFHFADGTLDTYCGTTCDTSCYFTSVVGRGDAEGLPITGTDIAASKQREIYPDDTKTADKWSERFIGWLCKWVFSRRAHFTKFF